MQWKGLCFVFYITNNKEGRTTMKKLVKPVAQKNRKNNQVVLMGGSKEEGCKHNQCFKC